MFDCRQPLLDALSGLSTLGSQRNSSDSLSADAYRVVKSFHHHCSMWQFNFNQLLDSADRSSLDELYRLAESMFGRPSNWSQKAIKSGRKWTKVRKLAEAALRIVESVPAPDTTATQLPSNLRVRHYRAKRIENRPDPAELVEDGHGHTRNDDNWHALREALLYTCAKHGHVGPDDPSPDPDFWLVDDRYNDERYHYMEAHRAAAVSRAWIADVTCVLSSYSGWGVGVSNIREGYLLVFADQWMVTGKAFRSCRNAEQVLEAIRRAIKPE